MLGGHKGLIIFRPTTAYFCFSVDDVAKAKAFYTGTLGVEAEELTAGCGCIYRVAASQVPFYVRLGNVLTLTLLRAGFKLRGPFLIFGNYPMYLLTVRGRKSGQSRTVALAMIERNGKRYVGSPFGIVDWVRNLRAAEEAALMRGRRSEKANARELPQGEAAFVLREDIKDHETSMDEIAVRVGIAKGTVYLHFPSKEDLVMAIFERSVRKLFEGVEASIASETTTRAKMEAALRFMYGGFSISAVKRCFLCSAAIMGSCTGSSPRIKARCMLSGSSFLRASVH